MQKKHELTQKLQKNQSFYNEMLNADQNYKTIRIHAHYQNLSSINEKLITKFQYDKKLAHEIYFVYGMYINQNRLKMELVTQYFVTVFPKPKNPYIFVYFNDFEVDNNFSNFKNMLGLMPVEYFINLQAIYLVRPSLKMKASRYFTFGTISKYINNKIVNVDELDDLGKKIGVKKQQILKFIPNEIKNYFVKQQQHKSSYIMVPQSLILTKSSGPIIGPHANLRSTPNSSPKMSSNKNPNSAIFSSSSNQNKQSIKLPIKIQINQYDKFDSGIPQVFGILLHYFKEHSNELEQQGIFRKSVNIQQQTQALEKIHKKQYDFIEKIKDPHLVANLIKRFLSKLKTPIIQYQIFQTIMDCQDLTPQFLAQQIKLLSMINPTKYLTLMNLLDFLIHKVIPRSHKNKMPAQNVAICFAPCLMWAEQRSIKDLIYMSKSVGVVVLIINNFETIFGNQKQIRKILRTSYYQQKTKSIIQTYNVQKLNGPHILQQQRKTPNFGLLILQKSRNEQKVHQQDQLPLSQQKQKIQININILSPNKASKSHVQTKQLKQDQKLLQNQLQKEQRKSQRSVNLYTQKNSNVVQMNIVRNRALFKSQIRQPQSPRDINDRFSSNQSDNQNQIRSIHSGKSSQKKH